MATPLIKQIPKSTRVVCADPFAFLCTLLTLFVPLLTWLVKAPWMEIARTPLRFLAFVTAISLLMRYLYIGWVFSQGRYADGYINEVVRDLRKPLVKVYYTYTLAGMERYGSALLYANAETKLWQSYTYVQVVTPPFSPNRSFVVKQYIPD